MNQPRGVQQLLTQLMKGENKKDTDKTGKSPMTGKTVGSGVDGSKLLAEEADKKLEGSAKKDKEEKEIKSKSIKDKVKQEDIEKKSKKEKESGKEEVRGKGDKEKKTGSDKKGEGKTELKKERKIEPDDVVKRKVGKESTNFKRKGMKASAFDKDPSQVAARKTTDLSGKKSKSSTGKALIKVKKGEIGEEGIKDRETKADWESKINARSSKKVLERKDGYFLSGMKSKEPTVHHLAGKEFAQELLKSLLGNTSLSLGFILPYVVLKDGCLFYKLYGNVPSYKENYSFN